MFVEIYATIQYTSAKLVLIETSMWRRTRYDSNSCHIFYFGKAMVYINYSFRRLSSSLAIKLGLVVYIALFNFPAFRALPYCDA
jgi:hypothetical protein